MEGQQVRPRHALQAAALQFGNDGTERSLQDLLNAMLALPFDQWPEGSANAAASMKDLAGDTFLHPAVLTEE